MLRDSEVSNIPILVISESLTAGALMSRASDDESFFDQVYNAHIHALHSYFIGRTSSRSAALDLLQETFLRVWRNIDALRNLEPNRHKYWLFSVAKNLVIDYYRKRGKDAALQDDLTKEPQDGMARLDVISDVTGKEDVSIVEDATRKLPEEMRTVLTMTAISGLSSKEIALRLGKPAGTIRYLLSIARKRLAVELKSQDSLISRNKMEGSYDK